MREVAEISRSLRSRFLPPSALLTFAAPLALFSSSWTLAPSSALARRATGQEAHAHPRLIARGKGRAKADPHAYGIGKTCKTKQQCLHKDLVCLKEYDANAKELPEGLCALPCTAIDAGTTLSKQGPRQLDPTPENVAQVHKPAPPRCPHGFQCRSAGNGVPIDLCTPE